MMRVLVASWSLRQVGGAESYTRDIMGLLASAGCEVAFAYEVDVPSNRARMPLPHGTPAFCLTRREGREGFDALRAWQPEVIFVQGLVDPGIEEQLLSEAPAVLFAHSYYGTCISGDKTHKLPVVQPCGRTFGAACLALYYPRRCGGLNPVTMMREYSRQRRRRSALERYSAVVTASEHMRRELLAHGAAGGRVVVCSMPIAFRDRVQPAGSPRSADAPWRLVFAGRMDRLKGGLQLLKALPYVRQQTDRPVVLTLAGDGPERSAWELCARQIESAADVCVQFAGWLDAQQLGDVLDASDVMVMPSLWPEPYGLAGVEANGRGLPVAAYATGGIPEWLLDGHNGCLAPAEPPTVEGLADAICRCLARLPELRRGALERGQLLQQRSPVQALLHVLRDAARSATPAVTTPRRAAR